MLMSTSKSFTADMEKKILALKNDFDDDDDDASKNNHRQKTNHNQTKSQHCDASVTQSDANKVRKCDEEVSTGMMRRCSTKRYALVRQSKVIGEKQRQKIEEK
jgi:Skp family chaperone for outer membrane proteins